MWQSLISGLSGLALGIPGGYALRPYVKRWNNEDFTPLMERVVNAEGAEERRNAIRRQLHDAGRRSMRLDGGAPARVHKMRRKRGTRVPPH